MADPIGLATFPGVVQIADWHFTMSHGISPSVCTITIAPQAKFPRDTGTLIFSFGKEKIEFPDCKVDVIRYERNAEGLIWRLHIWDRRWKWQGKGHISGFYNQKQADGKVDPATEKTPQELAKLCLVAIGEQHYDVSDLPNDQRPLIAWDSDQPMQALASLCDALGFRIMLDLKNRVVLRKAGDGKQLPRDLPIIDESGASDPPERPDSLLLVGAIERYQRQLKLEAVGVDVDGKVKKIDDLSYKPGDGWGNQPVMEDIWDYIEDCESRRLAQETVFRWYRVMGYRDGTLNFPGLPSEVKITHIRQILPLEDGLVEQVEEPLYDNRKADKPARVYGRWSSREMDSTAIDVEDCSTFDLPFSLDRARGIVKFSTPICLDLTPESQTDFKWGPAELFLECAFGVRDKDTRAFRRWTREFKFSGKKLNTKPQVVRDDGFAYTNLRRVTNTSGITSQSNEEDLNELADQLLKDVAKQFETNTPADIVYAGLAKIELDGAIQQVTWRGGESGCTTTASRNTEHNDYVPSYAERRMLERGSAANKTIQPSGVDGVTLDARKFLTSQGQSAIV